jgi:hypothetical protein
MAADQLAVAREIAKKLLAADETEIARAIEDGELLEVQDG